MFRCSECKEVFAKHEADELSTTYEDYYGVSDLFHNSTDFTYLSCPFCGSDELEEYIKDDDDEEEEESEEESEDDENDDEDIEIEDLVI